jgi:hypothetical protein
MRVEVEKVKSFPYARHYIKRGVKGTATSKRVGNTGLDDPGVRIPAEKIYSAFGK